jgi:hypothetical protein
LAWWCFFGNETHVVRNELSQRAWPRSRNSSLWSKWPSVMSDNAVDSPVSTLSPSLSPSPMSCLVSSSCVIHKKGILVISNMMREGR